MAGPVRVLVDCDPGVDDALALLVLAGLAHAGEVRVEAVTAVAGNMPVEACARNAACVLDWAGRPDVPVHLGAAGPLEGEPATGPRDPAFHGPDGLGGLYRPGHPAPRPEPAAGVIARFGSAGSAGSAGAASSATPEGTGGLLLALGPLTNVATALAGGLRPAAVVAMGGVLGADPAATEFNWRFDPVAADRVCQGGADVAPVPVAVVPFDVTRQVGFTEADVAGLDSPAADLLRAQLALQRRARGRAGAAPVHDAVAAVLALRPDLARWEPLALRVETAGPHRGAVRVETSGGPGRQPVRVARAVDAPAVHAVVLDALGAGGHPPTR